MPAVKTAPLLEKMNEWVTNHLPIPFVQKILFVHNLHIMIKSGLSIVDGLRILSEQMDNKRLKKILGDIKRQVEKGRQLSEVLSEYPTIFPPIYVSMIAAGETAGKMEESLLQVNNQMKKSHELTSRIKGALIYPAVILVAMAGIGIEMVVFVLPKIIVMFNDFHAELPLPTRALIWVVTTTGRYGIFFVVGFIALIALLVWLERKPRIKRAVHAFNLRLPIFGTIIKKINLARFTLTLSSLLQSAIPIIEAVKITSNVLGNVKYREDLLAAAEALKKGEPLSEALNQAPKRFPPMAVQMIMVGEQTGEMEQMLGELSEYYGDEVDNTMKNFSTIIEPVIILALGFAVAGIAVAVIMPMYSLAQSF
ncbi:MAG: type II secretion system F family protein [Candidatus Magasanikbacteria bacterium]|nr:type II secretion system F family protein [Candidatus Magasanikbacteria bacterium]